MAGDKRRSRIEYTTIVAEVFFDSSRGRKGVRPSLGQVFPQSMKIECAKEIRSYPLGTKVKLNVVEKDSPSPKPYLYSSYKWQHFILNE